MLRRTGFSRPRYDPPRAPTKAVPALFRPPARVDVERKPAPVPKERTVSHEGYRRLVAALPCICCGIPGRSQCAHPNTGKAMGRKLVDDRRCFPLCADQPERKGCHSTFDQGGAITKSARRMLEEAWGADTRRRILTAGTWPADLPLMTDDDKEDIDA